MRLLRWLLIGLALCAGMAQAQTPFNARDHDRQDLTYVQAALVFQGLYLGLLDGAWGVRSHAALAEFAARMDGADWPTDTHLAALLGEFESERSRAGWTRLNNDETNVTIMLPLEMLRETDPDLPYLTYATPGRDLLVRWIADTARATGDMHGWARGIHAGPDPAYSSATGDRIITAAQMASGRRVYLRSWARGGQYLTVLIQSDPAQHTRAALIAASLAQGAAPDLTLRPDGRLARLLVQPGIERTLPAAPKTDIPDTRLAKGTGTGFFVNDRDVVTAAHVIEGCRALSLGDGTPLSVVARAPAPDLAVLRAATPSADWLPLRADPELRLGQGVAAAGFPFLALTGGSLNLTMGNVSALRAIATRPDWVAISAPVQPGNSGGPLLSDMGEVVGVVVARANDGFYLKETGTLPQNINFAVRLTRLRAFLKDAGIALPPGTEAAAPLSQGLSARKQAAIRPVLCY
ncbi:S1C family serine protease [Oceaniglobus ichthyenteri]|uniref:S1C family serine protease n=1 Tax=Oceaniglobus ichthyenteri TaxID=2136177 RepID=UPI000D366A3F|nr:serine protease [Oceaniglobus ichthyenteri]